MLAFVLPCIVTLLSLGIVDMLIKPLQTLIDQISGQDSQDVFGANKFSVTAKAMEGVQKAMEASKADKDGGGNDNKQQKPDLKSTKSENGSGDKTASGGDTSKATDTAKDTGGAADAADTATNATDAAGTAAAAL